jgi:hypothetical protein
MALRIGIDVDGVLADFRTAFHTTAMRCLRGDVDAPPDSDQNPGPLTTDDVRRVWEFIGKTQNWWMEVPAYEPDEIARLYRLTRSAGWEVFFLTKRPPSAGDSVQFQTQWWIERFGFYLPAVLTVPGSRGEVASGLRLDLLVDDQLINCVEAVSASLTKAILLLRGYDAASREHATNRGIGVVATLADAISVIERLHDVLPQKRGRLLRLADWFSPSPSPTNLPQNPRTTRPIPPFTDPRR